MPGIRYSNSATVHGRGHRSGENLTVSAVEQPTNTGPSTVSGKVDRDAVYSTVTASGSVNTFKLIASRAASFVSDTPGVCAIDAGGNVTRVADGACTVRATDASGNVAGMSRQIVQAGATTYSQWTGWGVNSNWLVNHIASNISSLINGKTAGATTQNMWSAGSSFNATAPAGSRNAGMFASSMDFSPSSFCTQNGGNNSANARLSRCHLVSNRHVIRAAHVGSMGTIVWMRPDGSFVSSSAIDGMYVGQDLYVEYLGAAITGITPYYVLPSDYATYLPTLNGAGIAYNYGMGPVFSGGVLNLEGHSYADARMRLLDLTLLRDGYTTTPQSTATPHSDWSSSIISGDSSGASFLPINVGGLKPVLLGAMWQGGGLSEAITGSMATALESAMNTLSARNGGGTGYTLSRISLASFTAP